MLLLTLLAMVVMFQGSLTDAGVLVLLVIAAVGALGLCLTFRLGRGRLPNAALLVVLEELFVLGLIGPDPAVDAARAIAYLVSGVVVGVLLFRVPLPDRGLPLRGKWLRVALAVASLVGAIQFGPWWMGWWQFWGVAMLRPALLCGTGIAVWLVVETARTLSLGLPVFTVGVGAPRPVAGVQE